ncbi:MAG TPA: tRNA (adenosine(37)-N6)-threonylcarbamoyltransferase complex ATPase subunit type 1 TsaE [Patescibacteria group bacterium]|nr:tRNA (adenosine(37)-N6)-threonylcarbamoyltransferase complex ATPase subunit type 1 TsaE [Patescibacteria group bacterium]
MSTAVTWQTTTKESSETEALAEKLGAALRGGEVIELASDLGGGKTTFTRGLARGAGSKNVVASPTFTISKYYTAPKFDIHHFDFYRLAEPGLMTDTLAEVIGDPHVVTVVEWGEIVSHVLPTERLSVHIAYAANGNRKLTFSAPHTLHYLMEAVK